MDKEEILKKAIKRAVKCGYKLPVANWYSPPVKHFYMRIIPFSHSFAKAFWGEEHNWIGVSSPSCTHCGVYGKTGLDNVFGFYAGRKPRLKKKCDKAWKNRLKQMVLEKDPIKYLEKFL